MSGIGTRTSSRPGGGAGSRSRSASASAAATALRRPDADCARAALDLGGAREIAREREHPLRRDVQAEELRRDILDLVGLVEDHDLVGRQHLRLGPLAAQREVGEVEVVVDDDELRVGGAAAHLRDEALLEERAARADARLGRRLHVAPERGVVREIGQVGAISRGRLADPGEDPLQLGVGQ